MKMISFFLLASFVLPLCLPAHSQDAWELEKDKSGVKIYTKRVDTSKFKVIKVECTLDGTVDRLDAILRDVANHKKWIYSTKRSFLVRAISNDELVYYTETFLPWPCSNRDVVIKMVITRDPVNRSEVVETFNVNGVLGENRGIVRVPHLFTRWLIKGVGNDKVNIVYYFSTDPGGSLPAWIVNTFAVKGPYETFVNLAALLKQ